MLLNHSVFKYFWGTTHPQNPQILLMKLKFHLLIIKKKSISTNIFSLQGKFIIGFVWMIFLSLWLQRDEKAAKEIGAYSKEINTLTVSRIYSLKFVPKHCVIFTSVWIISFENVFLFPFIVIISLKFLWFWNDWLVFLVF